MMGIFGFRAGAFGGCGGVSGSWVFQGVGRFRPLG